jgi:hypothetical protein
MMEKEDEEAEEEGEDSESDTNGEPEGPIDTTMAQAQEPVL